MGRLGCNDRHLSAIKSLRICSSSSVLLLLFLFLSECSPCGEAAAAWGVPISKINRRPTGTGSWTPPSARHLPRRRLGTEGGGTVGAVEVADCENSEYSGIIGLGTPLQEFEVVFDTGSYSLWVTGAACKKDCDFNNKYNSSLSSTYVKDGTVFTQAYEDGSEATGMLSVDKLSIGGLTTTATFGEIRTRSLDGCDQVDGILGMGPPSASNEQSVFLSIVEAGVVDVPIFSFFLGNIDTDSPTGVLTLGGVNQTHYEGDAQKDLRVGPDSVILSPASAIFDTGTSMIVGPYDDVGYIADMIGAWCIVFEETSSSKALSVDCVENSRETELIMIPCDEEFDDIGFYFGGDRFSLTSKELLLPLTDFSPAASSTADDPWCLFGMMGHEMEIWVLGDSFLRTFYSAYNVQNGKVGLAKATGRRTSDECPDDSAISGVAIADQAGAADAPEDDVVPPSPSVSSSGGSDKPQPSSSGGASTGVGDERKDDDGSSSEEYEEPGEGYPVEQSNSSDGGSIGGGGEGQDESILVTVATAASLGTLIAIAACGGFVVLVVRQIRKGQHRHIKLGALGAEGGLEMADKTEHGVDRGVPGAEDDFLQAGPGGYRGSGSGSHRYRVAAAQAGANGSDSRTNHVTVLGTGGAEDNREEEEEVEVNLVIAQGAVAETRLGRLRRVFGRGPTGFAPFDDQEELVDDQTSGESAVI